MHSVSVSEVNSTVLESSRALVVLDDPVMNDGETVVRGVRMRVALAGHAVGGPRVWAIDRCRGVRRRRYSSATFLAAAAMQVASLTARPANVARYSEAPEAL